MYPSSADADVARGQQPEEANPLRARREPEAIASLRSSNSATNSAPEAETEESLRYSGQSAVPHDAPSAAEEPRAYAENLPSGSATSPPSSTAAATPQWANDLPRARPLPHPAASAAFGSSPNGAKSNATALESPMPYPNYASGGPNVPTDAAHSSSVGLAVSTPAPSDLGASRPNPKTVTPGLATTAGTGRPGERQLEGPQAPVLSIEKLAPPEIQVGKACTFAVRVRNNGERTVEGVQVRDAVPYGMQLTGTMPRANQSGSELVWNLGPIAAGEERTVEMEFLPTDEGELGSVATVSFTAAASAKARCTRPELRLTLTAQPQVMIGEQQLVHVEVTNSGSGDATGVILMESVPVGVTHPGGAALELQIGTLPAGQSRQLDLVLSATQAGHVINTMIARGDANLEAEASVEFDVIAPELHIAIEGPQKRFLERPATYVVSVQNPGTAPAKEVQFITKLPAAMQFVRANNMGEYDAATRSIYWSLVELPAGGRGEVEFVALPTAPGEHRLEATTTAQQGLEDRTETKVSVEGIAALLFEVVDLEDPIEVGGETSYEIRVLNQGSKAATNVQVAAILDAGLRAVSAEGEGPNAIQADRVVFQPLPTLAPKTEVVFRVRVQGAGVGDQRMRVQVVSDDIQQPITKEENTRVYADQ